MPRMLERIVADGKTSACRGGTAGLPVCIGIQLGLSKLPGQVINENGAGGKLDFLLAPERCP